MMWKAFSQQHARLQAASLARGPQLDAGGATCLRRRLRHDAVAEIEDERRAAQSLRSDFTHARSSRRATGNEQQADRDCPARQRAPRSASAAHLAQRHRRIAPDPSTPVSAHVAFGIGAGPARKADDRTCRDGDASARDDSPRRLHHPAVELLVGQIAGPAVEDLQHVGAGAHLAVEIFDRGLDQRCRSAAQSRLRIAIGPRAAPRAWSDEPCAADHVGRDRPRRAAKADQRRLARQILAQARDGLEDAAELVAGRRPDRGASSSARRRDRRRAAAPRPRRSARPGRARRARPGCRRTGSPHRSRSGGSAAASPRRPAPACSTGRGSRRPWRAPRGTPAGSARPAASARSAAATAPRRQGR